MAAIDKSTNKRQNLSRKGAETQRSAKKNQLKKLLRGMGHFGVDPIFETTS